MISDILSGLTSALYMLWSWYNSNVPSGSSSYGSIPRTEILYRANNDFSAQMLYQVYKNNADQSVVLSAFSVLTPLAQLALGSSGTTRNEITSILGLKTDDEIVSAFGSLAKKFNKEDNGLILNQAARIYVSKDVRVDRKFQQMSSRAFGSGVQLIDFEESREAAAAINEWVESKTNKRIKDLVSPYELSPNTRAILVNAIYFKGTWTHQFQPRQTSKSDFYVSKSNIIQVDMMRNTATYTYSESRSLNAKLLQMNYDSKSRKERLAFMLIMLPNEVEGLPSLVKKLRDPEVLAKAAKEMKWERVSVSIPKFRIETTTDLKAVLKKLGVKKVFKDGDLSKLLANNDEKLVIDSAVQKAFIDVNEYGTEAAAANSFIISKGKLLGFKPAKNFNADHPFVFLINDGETVLFNGAVVAPHARKS